MMARVLVVLVCVAAARGLAAGLLPDEAALARTPLAEMPRQIGEWQGMADPPLPDDILAVLGVDDYLTRRYVAPGTQPVSLYIGYYGSQRRGSTIHSPQHCLPGTGWVPVRVGRLEVDASGPVVVNRYLVQKDAERQLVFYWYQGRGRIVASDYLNKFYLVYDAIRHQRSDGALVRVSTPVVAGEAKAEQAGVAFIRALQPLIGRYVP